MIADIMVSASPADAQNLLILTDSQTSENLTAHLSDGEYKAFLRAQQKDITPVCFLRENGLAIVQEVKPNEDPYTWQEELRLAGNQLLSTVNQYKTDRLTVLNLSTPAAAYFFTEGLILGNYRYTRHYSDQESKKPVLREIAFLPGSISEAEATELRHITVATGLARDLVNEPHSSQDAEQLSHEIRKAGEQFGFSVEVLGEQQIKALKMGGLLAVNQGSTKPPTFNILEWNPDNAVNTQPIVLVGKGVVYDTGGLSLKPTQNGMDMMKSDMAGAACVIGVFAAIAQARLPVHIIGLIPATDNRPGNNAYAPGDVIVMHSGKTVEVLDTDAEGRLVLADALHYAKKYQPSLVFDFATLTGAAARAGGTQAICYMGNASRDVKEKIEKSGFEVYERLIELPLWKEYDKQLQSNVADLRNIGGAFAGAITAGKFLEHFTDYPWLHFDIAGTAFLRMADAYRVKEATGAGVRLVYDFLKKQ
jgi:leucyl aminopeptidase